ncbi:methionine--tRNA ligase, mitochondrial [Leguminivora glycinivorella]|uniref:methionine--tRNA ligase, mitochondrial n=1 Tax=Leguminivora glycinivorella TaxID=1035111 RepID=UPI00200C49C5|nr:methionine--tRNA ligase, mitochondrial [Leguminivora glycinivorella]
MRLTLRLFSSVVQKRPFFVSTPIFYVNAAPHLGHLYSAVVADAIQRFEKLVDPNCNVLFSTGTDEHGTKIQQAASKAGQAPAEYCSAVSEEYRRLFAEYHVEHTHFVRTTEDRHKKAVAHFWNELVEGGHIYKAVYSGWYSVSDESFVPEAHTKEILHNGRKVKVSVESGHEVEWTEEPNYMFRLSAFREHLQRWLKTDGVITPSKFQKQLQELLEKETYFPDISVSRPASRVHWAIRVPGDEDQSIYVWLDALVNYLTVTGYPDEDAMRVLGRAWPADVHVVGKDILKFHGLYWPAFLMAARRHPPRRLVCHAHFTVRGVKMSKSLGNVVCPRSAPVTGDALRYFLLREGTLHSDANYSETKLINIVNSELADTLGNLVSRCCGAALNPRGEFPALHETEAAQLATRDVTQALLTRVERLPDQCREYYSTYQFYKAVDEIIATLHACNLFFEALKPWELRKENRQRELDVVLHLALETLRVSAIVLQPVIPQLATSLLDRLQIPKDCRSWEHCETASWRVVGAIPETNNIRGGKFVLFPRVYVDRKPAPAPQNKKKAQCKAQ